MNFKKFIKTFLSENTITFLKKIKIKLNIKNYITYGRNLFYLRNINKRKSNDKINIIFICQCAQCWNSLRSVYEASLKDEKINPILIALPEKKIYKGFDLKHSDYEDNLSYKMLLNLGYNVIDGYENNKFVNLKEFKPDYLFYPRPYENYLPKEYSTAKINRYTKICYVNYCYNITNWDNRVSYNIHFLRNIYCTFAENQDSFNFLTSLYSKTGCKWNKLFFSGYPRFDLINIKKNNKKATNFLWTPRWTSDEGAMGSSFFLLKDKLFDYFKQRKDFKFTFRPHPLLIRNFLSTGELTSEDVDKLNKIFIDNENFYYDKESDYLTSFTSCDVMITDPTSLIVEFFYTGKPIIYIGDTNDFNEQFTSLINCLYIVNSPEELINRIELLAKGIDEKENIRKINKKTLCIKPKIGESIIKFIEKDYYNLS